jgi:hypothetical protein
MKLRTNFPALLGLLWLVGSAHAALLTNLVKTTVGSADTLPVAMRLINTNLAGLDADLVTTRAKVMADFSLVLIPDTQYLVTSGNSNTLCAMFERIEANRSNYNTLAVLGLGDIVDDDSIASQWTVAKAAYARLTNSPVLLGVGNHESWTSPNLNIFNTNFTRGFYTNKSWFSGGFYTNSEQQNAFILLTNGPLKILAITAQWGATTNHMAWVTNICGQFPEHMALFITHNYLMPDGRRGSVAAGDPYQPGSQPWYQPDGVTMWNDYLRFVPNLAFIGCGHQPLGPYETNTVSVGVYGNRVNQMLCCHQASAGLETRARYVFVGSDGYAFCRTWEENSQSWLKQYDASLTLRAGGVEPQKIIAGVGVSLSETNDGRSAVLNVTSAPSDFYSLSNRPNLWGVTNGPLLWLTCNDTNEPNRLLDYSGWGNSPTGFVRTTEAGLDKRSFDQTLTNAVVVNTSAFDTSGSNLTASCWFRTSSSTNGYGSARTLVAKFRGSADGEWMLDLVDGVNTLRWELVVEGVRRSTGATPPFTAWDGEWHHVVGRFDGTNAALFIDGLKAAQNAYPGAITNTTRKLFIGGHDYTGNIANDITTVQFPFAGDIDEVKVWRRALTDGELYAEHWAGLTKLALPRGRTVDVVSYTNTFRFKAGILETNW